MTIEALAERCEALEVNLAFQEKLARELDDLVRDLGNRLHAAERTIAELKQTMMGGGGMAVGPANDPPPHY